MLKHVAQAAIAGNDVAEPNWTKMQGKSFVVAVIVQATVDLNLAIIEENDMANRPFAPKNVLTGKASPFHLRPSQMGIRSIFPQIEHCHTPLGNASFRPVADIPQSHHYATVAHRKLHRELSLSK